MKDETSISKKGSSKKGDPLGTNMTPKKHCGTWCKKFKKPEEKFIGDEEDDEA